MPRPGDSSTNRRLALGALAILVLGLVLRVPRGDLAEWKSDEALLYEMARSIARGRERPLLGEHTTDGPRQAVHFLYIFAAPIALRDGPESVRLEIAILSSLACALVVLPGARVLGGRTALASGLLLAVLPDQVRRGRWLWGANLMGPFCVLALVALAWAVRRPRGRGAGGLLVVSGFLPLLHYSLVGPALLGGAAVVRAVRRGARRDWLWLGLAVTVALYLPHLAGEIETGFEDTLGALRIVTQGKKASHATGSSPEERSPVAYPRFGLDSFRVEAYGEALGKDGLVPEAARGVPRPLEQGLDLVLLLTVLGGAVLGAVELFRALVRREVPRAGAMALAFGLAGWLPFLATRIPSRDHYAQAIVPALAVLAGHALARAAGHRVPRGVTALLLFVIASACVLETRAVLTAIDAGLSPPAQVGYDLPYREKRAACQVFLDRGLALVEYPPGHHEYPILLAEMYRELPPEEAARFELHRVTQDWTRYWSLSARGLEILIPVLPGPLHGAAILVAPPGPVPGELARVGRLAIASR